MNRGLAHASALAAVVVFANVAAVTHAKDPLAAAKDEIAKGEYSDASRALERDLKRQPGWPEAAVLLCDARMGEAWVRDMTPGDEEVIRAGFAVAADACERAAALDADAAAHTRVSRLWAHAVVRADRETDALRAYQAWAQAAPDDPYALGGLAAWLDCDGRVEEAEASLDALKAGSRRLEHRARFEYVCRAADPSRRERLRPSVQRLLDEDETPVGKAMIGVLSTSIERGREDGLLSLLGLIERGDFNDSDAHAVWSCLADESLFSRSVRRPPQVPGLVYPKRTVDGAPDYPEDMRRSYVQGKALALARVNLDGTLGPVWIAKATTPEFGAAAIRALTRWRYTPAQKDGEIVPYPWVIHVDFRLKR